MAQHVALYRKYRPAQFKDVLGQEHIVKPLLGALKLGNISHAYLFAGTRGTGKTSIARIFAKEIGTTQNDIYEIDAASNRGIDDVRALRDGVSTLPLESKYKVYIVDEVHMLTKEAFNALLKTLEEPPKHVIFILATTEIEKLPETIISRCQVFQFKKPSQEILKDVVLRVAKAEGFSLEVASAELIALLGDGSFRDTLGIVEKVIGASSDKKISVAEVESVTGAPRAGLVNSVIESLNKKDVASGLSAVETALKQDANMKVFLKMVLRKLRFVLLLRFAPDFKNTLVEEVSAEDLAFLEKVASTSPSGINAKTLDALLEAYTLASFSALPELPLELALIKLNGEKS